jgi:Secretion system C-terminal sorting domain
MNCITALKFNLIFLLIALPLGMNAQVFSDGFESGTYTPIWTTESGSYTRIVDAVSPALGTYSFHITGGTGTSHLNGISKTFTASQPNEVSYRVKGDVTSANGYVVMGDAGLISNGNQMLFSRFQSTGNLNFYAGATEYNYPASSDTWYHVELKNIDWTNKEFDIYVDGALQYTNFPFRDQTINNIDRVHFYNYNPTTASLDDVNIGAVAPPCSTPPTAICQNITVNLDAAGSYSIIGSDLDGGSVDNCSTSGLTFTASQTTFTCSDIGSPIAVNLTVNDGNGNSAVCVADVTVADIIIPTASEPAPLVVQCILDVPAPDPLVFTDEADNCGVPTVSYVSEVSTGSCPESITRTYSVTDASGNSINVNHIIIVLDDTAPTASNPSTVNIECQADVPAPDVSAVTDENDNCTISPVVTWVGDVSDGLTCPETITRTYRITDDCGNFFDVSQLIIILDVTPPVPNGGLSTVNSFCDVTLSAPSGTDNCDGATTPVADVTFPITAIGTTTVTWTHTDQCGNMSTETQDVVISVIDITTSQVDLTLSSNNTNATAYQWIDCSNNQPISGETTIDFTAIANGDYAVIVTEGGCSDTSACVTINNVGIEAVHMYDFTLYPNPTEDGKFTISTNAALKSIEVIDMLGRKVKVLTDLNEGVVDGSNLTPGKYLVHIITVNDQLLMGNIVIM